MLTQEQKQLIRDLNSYNYLHIKLADMTDAYANSLNYLDRKIRQIDEELNEHHVPSIKYDSISISKIKANSNPRVIELIFEQDKLNIKRKKKIKEQEKEINKIVSRIEDVELLLSKINKFEKEFITHMYIDSKCVEYMMDEYHISKSTVFRKATKILNKMLKK